MDKKLESAVSRMQEMMKGMFKEFFGEGAVGGGSPRSWGGPEGLQKVEKSGEESDGSDLGAVKKEKKGEMLAKGIREDKVKKGGEEKKKKGMGLRKDEKKVDIGKLEKRLGKLEKSKEQDESELDSEDWIRVVEKKGKKSAVGRMDVSVEVDSLYSEECKKGQSETSGSDSESEKEVRKAMYVREVPRCEKYEEYGSRDIRDFFREYEGYCMAKYGENKRVWARELGGFLTGFLLSMYGVVMSVGHVSYESIKR
ncbi:high mobility group nucleosome-binding domain-containing protein 5-like [Macrobrachium rosenbergii]|uniref:high mobility group nucleosome-binding domain-containing protein 5-like n=1 Tax=Macrobrachium rosenbergii TaxID=79674 RepID=UPI0034D77799